MTPKRKKAQDDILNTINAIAGDKNHKLYKDLFKSMSDKDFDKFMVGLRDKTITLCIIVPHEDNDRVSFENNVIVGRQLGYEFFQRLRFKDPDTGETYLSPNKFLIYKLPVRRTSQLLIKGVSIPKDAKAIDAMSGQVTGSSRASKITLPETQLLMGMGLENTVEELLKFRGGDLGAKNAMMNMLYKNGRVTKAEISEYATGVVSTKTLKNYLISAHIKSEGLDNK